MAAVPPVQERVRFVYELETDEVDVFRLAPALMAIGNLVREGRRTVFPNELDEVGVSVQPFREGSFLVDFVLFLEQHTPDFFAAIGPDALTKITEVLRLLGLVRGTVTSVLDVIKRLPGGRPKQVTPISNREVRYESDNVVVNVGAPVHQLMVNPTIHNYIHDALALPLETPNVTGIRTYLQNDPASSVSVGRADADAIRVASAAATTPPIPQQLDTKVEIVRLNPLRGPFQAERRQWTFAMGNSRIVARISDQEFLRRYDSGEIRLNHADLLEVELIRRERLVGTETKTQYEIRRVLNYTRGAHQQSFPI